MLIQANALHIPLANESVHMCVTSPPYWSLRDYKCDGQLGLEPTPDEYVANMVAAFREVRRVLRQDGTCWLNIGDSYAGSWGNYAPGGIKGKQRPQTEQGRRWKRDAYSDTTFLPPTATVKALKPKDLCGIPWRVALALQTDGWWIRSDIIWAKPNPMPESVRDRPTRSHEYLFLLTKAARYYYDAEAIRQPNAINPNWNYGSETYRRSVTQDEYKIDGDNRRRKAYGKGWQGLGPPGPYGTGRNKRSVWYIATEGFPGAHFAVYPPALVEPCILAGTSAVGVCPQCGAPWRRVMEREKHPTRDMEAQRQLARIRTGRRDGHVPGPSGMVDVTATVGWQPTCRCGLPQSENMPATVLDPFVGSGTTLLVAQRLGRRGVGLDLSREYCYMAQRRVADDMPLLAVMA